MKRLLTLALMCAISAVQAAGAPKVNAVVLSHEESFVMNSATSGKHTVRTCVQVNNKSGLSQAVFLVYTDSFETLGSFSGEIVGPGGKKTKIKEKDLETFSISEGLASDNFVSRYVPQENYPFTVTYSYTVNYKNGIVRFPVFFPMEDEKVSVINAKYSLDLPAGTEILTYYSNAGEPSLRTEKGRDIHEWTVSDVQPYVEEDFMPSVNTLVPFVLAAPVNFTYSGTKGVQADWKQYGDWLYSLQKGSLELDNLEVAKFREMVKDCPDDFSKVKVLYNYLREHTRYVNISLGIGGVKPIPANKVAERGFGDCKALSNYMQAMLKAVGIDSDYYIIHTSRRDLLPGFSTIGQMNHAMLAVPLPEKSDTLFIECTNPTFPLGYRHSSAAGHEVVLIKPDGGQLVRIGSYPDSLYRSLQYTKVQLEPDGSASIQALRKLDLFNVEGYIGFRDRSRDAQTKMLSAYLKMIPNDLKVNSVRDNFDDYPLYGRNYCPEISIGYSMTTNLYANKSGDRLFVPINPINGYLSFQKSERVNDIVIRNSRTFVDKVTIVIPEGWSIEALPEDVSLDEEWGSFVSKCVVEGGQISVEQELTLKRCREDKSRYDGYRDFARKVSKAYDGKLVLKK